MEIFLFIALVALTVPMLVLIYLGVYLSIMDARQRTYRRRVKDLYHE